MKEIFRDIRGYEGSYQISNLGRVKSLPRKNSLGVHVEGRILQQSGHKDSYLHMALCKNGVRKTCLVHRLVALAFLANEHSDKLEVNHKNGDKQDNKVGNLEWVTSSYNSRHAFDVLGYKGVRGSAHGQAKLEETEVFEIKRLLKKRSMTQSQIGDMFGVGSRAISKISTGIRWGHV